MKISLVVLVSGLAVALSGRVGAEAPGSDRAAVEIKVPQDLVSKTCPSAVWGNSTLLWKGVTDSRSTPEIGLQSRKKGKEPVSVLADPSLEVILNGVMPDLLSACGIHLVKEGKIDREISAEVREFYAGVEKGIFTGKSVARSRITFVVRDRGEIIKTIDVGYEMETKKIRQKDLRQLEGTLNELLARTLEEVPRLDGLKEL